jgi:organic hydroperoxide reductase OsmC/OhrA
MVTYTATTLWARRAEVFTDGKYSRGHRWRFDGGVEVPASSSPHSVRLPYSIEAAVDPEEAFVAALSSCHLLCFLFIAATAGFVVDRYEDIATGTLDRNAEGRLAMTAVVLRPHVAFNGSLPSADTLRRLHQEAHDECYIASSVKTDVRVEPRLDAQAT